MTATGNTKPMPIEVPPLPSAAPVSDRLAILMDMLAAVSEAETPNDAVTAFASGFWKIRRVDKFFSISRRNLEPHQYKVTRKTRTYVKDDQWIQEIAPMNPWRDWDMLPTHTGGFVGSVIAGNVPQLLNDLDLSADPVLGAEFADMHSCLALPTFDRGETLNWSFQLRAEPDGFTVADLEQALLTTNLFGSMTRNLVALNDNRLLTARLQRQFQEVARVQQALLPSKLPEVPGVKFASSYLPSEEAGGDYYDFFELPSPDGKGPPHLFIVIADVSGHGPAAATVMAMLHALLHAHPSLHPRGPGKAGETPCEVIRWANERLMHAGLDGAFVTAFVGEFNPQTRELIYCNAGHPPPRIKNRGAAGNTQDVVELEGESTFPLGIIENMPTPCNKVALHPGQTLVLYTDGIHEARNKEGVMFGVQRIDEALHRCSGEADCIIDSIHTALYEFTRARTRDDDQTLVVMQFD